MDMPTPPHRIAVAVSGGADSLHAMLRLKEQGCGLLALHGLFLPQGTDEEEEKAALMRDRLEAACRALDVPLHYADLRDAFHEQVIRPFVQSYADGHTPNPCALCNVHIKFGLLQDAAFALGATAFATGHYASLRNPLSGPAANSGETGDTASTALFQGADSAKDQSYFLALVPLERLARSFFPLERLLKSRVLAELQERGITPPQPGESQEVCFVPQDAYREFLPRTAAALGIRLPGPGPMLLADGTRLGTHKGLWRYTEGQRKGLGIGWKESLHVLAKERQGNILRLGGKAAMRVDGCLCAEANILLAPELWPDTLLVKTRYREKPKPAVVRVVPGANNRPPSLAIRFTEADSAVAVGQVAAVYAPESGAAGEPLRLVAGGLISGVLQAQDS